MNEDLTCTTCDTAVSVLMADECAWCSQPLHPGEPCGQRVVTKKDAPHQFVCVGCRDGDD